MKRFLFIFMVVCVFLSFPEQKILAQASPTEPVDQLIVTEIIPETPRQNQDVNINIESYSYDLSRAKIFWYINNKLKDSGIGRKSFDFKTGSVGLATTIKYRIETQEGAVFEKNITISPGDVTILWESLGYTPPFFKGKSLFSFEGKLRLIAVANLSSPSGIKYKPEELVYTWRRGMGTDADASGYGKNIFLWNGSIISDGDRIEVDVTNLQNTTKATASITIYPDEVEIFAYENNPSLGILWNKTIGNIFKLTSNEISFVATPFYFNNPDTEGLYSWFVNGQKSPESSRYITFRNTKNEAGYSKISFDLSSQQRVLQSASSEFDVYFDTKNSNAPESIFKSFFGN